VCYDNARRALGEKIIKTRLKSTLKLCTYTGEALDNIRQAHVQVAYQDQTANLPLQIIKGKNQAYLEGTG